VQPLCAQWLCDGGFSGLSHHRATEHTKVAQSNSRSDETEESKNDKCSGIGLESNPVDYDHVFETTSNQTPPNGAASATRLTRDMADSGDFHSTKLLNLEPKTRWFCAV